MVDTAGTSAAATAVPHRASVVREPAARSWLLPFLWAGAACVVGGGLLAAATAFVTTEKTAWATAYIVLVGGAAQIVLGGTVTWLRPDASRRAGWIAFAAWNLGNAGVLVGQLAALVVVTDIGSAVLVVALVVVLVTMTRGRAPARGSTRYGPGSPEYLARRHPVLVWVFRVVLVILAAGIVVGTVLAQLA